MSYPVSRSPLLTLLAAALLVTAAAPAAGGAILFQEVGGAAGLTYTGISNGASWGEFNGDGWPDLWTGNHDHQPSLYLNNGDGTFTDVILQVWSGDPAVDTHGAAWADWDNDGDQDLLEMVGADHGTGGSPNLAYVNADGLLRDEAAALGLDYPLGRGRTPLWLDMDRDGLLDVVLCNRKRDDGLGISTIMRQEGHVFYDVGSQVGFVPTTSPHYALLSDLSGDGRLDLIVPGYPWPASVFDLGGIPLVNLLPQFKGLPVKAGSLIKDAAAADFNGDLRPDLFLVGDNGGSDVVQTGPSTLELSLKTAGFDQGIEFTAGGMVAFQIVPNPWFSRRNILIGAQGLNPGDHVFTLNAKVPDCWGMAARDTLLTEAVYIGYLPESKTWKFTVTSTAFLWTNTAISAEGPVALLGATGFKPFAPFNEDYLVLNDAAGFLTSPMGGLTAGGSVAAGDFDNDMDVDLFLVCSTPLVNLPDILYENLGNGSFLKVADAAGAGGTVLGLGESVAVADYDRDGFLDLVVTNGADYPPFADDGPYELFRNVSRESAGNSNHWLEADLRGTVSNRDGIGAVVVAHTPGRAQIREQNGGMHLYSQNFPRLHFGLGPHAVVDSLVVRWPSGSVQTIVGQPADRIITVVETAGVFLADGPSSAWTPGTRAARLGDAYPNPFNPRTRIAFALARTGSVRLEVFDVAGRRVAVLAEGEFGAGSHTVQWNGTGARGESLASGTYYCRLRVGNETQVKKMTLVR